MLYAEDLKPQECAEKAQLLADAALECFERRWQGVKL